MAIQNTAIPTIVRKNPERVSSLNCQIICGMPEII